MKLGALALGAAAAGASAYGAVAAGEAAAVMAGERPEDSQAIAQALTEHDDPTLGVVDRLLISVSVTERARHDFDINPQRPAALADQDLSGDSSRRRPDPNADRGRSVQRGARHTARPLTGAKLRRTVAIQDRVRRSVVSHRPDGRPSKEAR